MQPFALVYITQIFLIIVSYLRLLLTINHSMKTAILACLFLSVALAVQAQKNYSTSTDWLIQPLAQKAEIVENKNEIVLQNGLLKRTFITAPNTACVDYLNLSNGQQLLRAVCPAGRLGKDGGEEKLGGL